MTRVIVIAVALCCGAAPPGQRGPKNPPPVWTAASPPSEMLQIDGSKNPELIPQWSVWDYAFRVIANGPGALPTSVHAVVSSGESALVIKEARSLQASYALCQKRAAALQPLLGKESNASLDAKLRAITLECRLSILRARDKVLEALNPDGAFALRAFAESTKAGTTLSIRKKDLARFLEPE